MKYLLKIRFVGTDFCGFQVQPNKRSVQSTLQDGLEKLFGERYDIKGCSRTDSGVHANAFYATFELPDGASSITVDKIPVALNSVLPSDIAVMDAIKVSDDFHVRHDVVYKEYVYVINNSKLRDPFLDNRVYFYPKTIDDTMLAKMNEIGMAISGEHDFKCFMSSGSSIIDTVRNVKYVRAERDGDNIKIYAAADGFLYNMVRIISGTLLDAAFGKITPADIRKMIENGDRSMAGATLPACGLYLNKVVFKDITI